MKRKQEDNNNDFNRSNNKKRISVSDICLNNKENIDFKDGQGFSKLHWAAFNGNLRVVKDCIKNNANINLFTDDGDSALCLSIFNKNRTVTKYLVENGANVNVYDKSGNSPLHIACEYGDLDTVIYLLNNGAFVDIINKDGDNVLHYACELADQNLDVIRYLLSMRPTLNKLNLKNETPADICLYMKQFKGLEYLIKSGATFKVFSLDMLKYFRECYEFNEPQEVQTLNNKYNTSFSFKEDDSDVIGDAG